VIPWTTSLDVASGHPRPRRGWSALLQGRRDSGDCSAPLVEQVMTKTLIEGRPARRYFSFSSSIV